MFVFSGDSGEYIFVQSMAYVEHIGGTYYLGTRHRVRHIETTHIRGKAGHLSTVCTMYILLSTYYIPAVRATYLPGFCASRIRSHNVVLRNAH